MHQALQKPSLLFPKLVALLSLLGLALLANGCAALAALPLGAVVGSPNSAALEIHNTTEVRLQEKNFIVIKTNMVGEASGFSLFGLVTIVPARFTKAMTRLYAKSEMQPGRPQTFANLVLEQDSSYYVLFSIPRTYIRGDVIEFTPPIPSDAQSRPPPPEAGSKAR
jgi:hypothetical protein